jgi:hypothetical protein
MGNLVAENVNLGMYSMYSGSFTPSNNNTIPDNVVGLSFDNTYISSFTVTLSANITATSSLYETFVLEAVQLDSEWDLYVSSYGDSTDITFSITNDGRVQYTTPNYPGFVNSIFRYQVSQISKTGSYAYSGTSPTQATLIFNTLQLLSTQDSVSGVNNGSLNVMGGCTISKTMFSNNVTTGDLRASYATLGNLTISTGIMNSVQVTSTQNAVYGSNVGSLQVLGGVTVEKDIVVKGNIYGIPQIAIIEEQLSNGTASVYSTTGSYVTRVLNTVVSNTISEVSLNSNQITLPSGTYKIDVLAPGYDCSRTKARLRNITDSSTMALGTNAYVTTGTASTYSHINIIVTISSTKVIEVQQFFESNTSNQNGGVATSSGDLEVYARIVITKLL